MKILIDLLHIHIYKMYVHFYMNQIHYNIAMAIIMEMNLVHNFLSSLGWYIYKCTSAFFINKENINSGSNLSL